MKNYYEILKIPNDASSDIIKKSVLTKIKEIRATGTNNLILEERLAEIKLAYSILSDDTRREEHDQQFIQYEVIPSQVKKRAFNKKIKNEVKTEMVKTVGFNLLTIWLG